MCDCITYYNNLTFMLLEIYIIPFCHANISKSRDVEKYALIFIYFVIVGTVTSLNYAYSCAF